MLNLQFPLEWTDGTPVTVIENLLGGSFSIRSEKPGFWSRSLPDPSSKYGVIINSDGTIDGYHGVYIRNMEMPIILDADGLAPIKMELSGRNIALYWANDPTTKCLYHWPNVRVAYNAEGEARPVTIVSKGEAQAAAERQERIAREREAMESNPLWGAF